MAFIEKIQDINHRVAEILKQQQQLQTQAKNWEHLYKEATDIQKKLLEQGTASAKQQDSLNTEIVNLKAELGVKSLEVEAFLKQQHSTLEENEGLKQQIQKLNTELHTLRLNEEQQLSIHFGAEKEQQQLNALCEDLKEQLMASQQLNAELQNSLQAAKITMVEEQAEANSILLQKENLQKELNSLNEKYQSELSELHSKNSQTLSTLEKVQLENRKLNDDITALSAVETEKLNALELLNSKIAEMELQISEPSLPNQEDYLITQIAQLKAQLSNQEFENELIKKNFRAKDLEQPAKVVEAVSQGSGSNEEQVHFLYSALQASQSTNQALENQIHNYIEIISKLQNSQESAPEELKNLQEQNKIVKLAEAIEGNTVASNIELRQKLNEMIKEVDRCIAKLSS